MPRAAALVKSAHIFMQIICKPHHPQISCRNMAACPSPEGQLHPHSYEEGRPGETMLSALTHVQMGKLSPEREINFPDAAGSP